MTEIDSGSDLTSGSRESVSDLIADRLSDLPQAERKVARALLSDYPSAGLGSASSLAQAAGVSAPSVIRFATSLGFGSYSAMQASLKNELRLRTEGPLGNITWERPSGSVSDQVVQGGAAVAASALQSLKGVPPQELEAAIALLSDPSRKVFLTGGRYSNILAKHLAGLLEIIRPKVRFIEHPFGSDLSALVSLGSRDIYVVFDFHRYQQSAMDLARQIKRRGATIILITDLRLSPVSAQAQVVLPISVAAPSPFYTFSGGMILVELISLQVLSFLGDKGREHLAQWDALRQRELVATRDDPKD